MNTTTTTALLLATALTTTALATPPAPDAGLWGGGDRIPVVAYDPATGLLYVDTLGLDRTADTTFGDAIEGDDVGMVSLAITGPAPSAILLDGALGTPPDQAQWFSAYFAGRTQFYTPGIVSGAAYLFPISGRVDVAQFAPGLSATDFGAVEMGLNTTGFTPGSTIFGSVQIAVDTSAVLWEQGPASSLGVIDQVIPDMENLSAYLLNDVTVPDGFEWTIDSVTTYFSNASGAWPDNVTQAVLNVAPKTGPIPPDTVDPTAGSLVDVTVTVSVIGAAEVTASSLAVPLPAGEHWIGLTPVAPSTIGQEFHAGTADTFGDPCVLRNPGGGLGVGTSWSPIDEVVDPGLFDTALRITGRQASTAPVGACCMAGGTCTEGLTEAECTATAACILYNVTIVLGERSEETTWSLVDAGGVVVSGGPFPPGLAGVTVNFGDYIVTGPWTFTLFDGCDDGTCSPGDRASYSINPQVFVEPCAGVTVNGVATCSGQCSVWLGAGSTCATCTPPTAGNDMVTVLEDSTDTLVEVAANDSDAEDGTPPGGTVALASPPPFGTATPAADGLSILYTPNAEFFGTDEFTYAVSDSIGLASNFALVTVTVLPVNDPPSFAVSASHASLEDAGDVVVPGFATTISAGPPNEAGQALAFTVTNDNIGLFMDQPSLAPDGTLTYRANPRASGMALCTATLMDNGGVANGGIDTSAPKMFTITVQAVNDPPMNTVPGAQTTLEDGVLVFSDANGNGISVDDVDAGGADIQVVLTAVNGAVSVDGLPYAPAQTITAPLASVNASLAEVFFRPDADFNFDNGGLAMLMVATDDLGNSAFASVGETDDDAIDITVTAVNDAPDFALLVSHESAEDDGPVTVPNAATGISRGPTADEAGQAVAFALVGNTNAGLFVTAPALAPNGTLTYQAAPDAFGMATVQFQIMDDGGTADGGIDTGPTRSITITVTPVNDPPSPVCQPVVLDATTDCNVSITAADVDGGSFDIDNDTGDLELSVNFEGPFTLGDSIVVLTVTDPDGLSGTCEALVTVLGNDCNLDDIPDSCQPDCDGNGIPDDCDTALEATALADDGAADDCENALPICPGTIYTGTTDGATQDGPFQACDGAFAVLDVWYRYRPAWSGSANVSWYGSTMPVIVEIWDGCPNDGGFRLDCSTSPDTDIVLAVTRLTDYWIRVAGPGFTTGDYQLQLTGPDCNLNPIDANVNGLPDVCDCIGEVNGDNVVSLVDLAMVTANLGATGGPADVDGSGTVTEADQLLVLENLGPCPGIVPLVGDDMPAVRRQRTAPKSLAPNAVAR